MRKSFIWYLLGDELPKEENDEINKWIIVKILCQTVDLFIFLKI